MGKRQRRRLREARARRIPVLWEGGKQIGFVTDVRFEPEDISFRNNVYEGAVEPGNLIARLLEKPVVDVTMTIDDPMLFSRLLWGAAYPPWRGEVVFPPQSPTPEVAAWEGEGGALPRQRPSLPVIWHPDPKHAAWLDELLESERGRSHEQWERRSANTFPEHLLPE